MASARGYPDRSRSCGTRSSITRTRCAGKRGDRATIQVGASRRPICAQPGGLAPNKDRSLLRLTIQERPDPSRRSRIPRAGLRPPVRRRREDPPARGVRSNPHPRSRRVRSDHRSRPSPGMCAAASAETLRIRNRRRAGTCIRAPGDRRLALSGARTSRQMIEPASCRRPSR